MGADALITSALAVEASKTLNLSLADSGENVLTLAL